MSGRRGIRALLTARRYRGVPGAVAEGNPARLHWTDVFSYGYLGLGVLLMFGPVIWLVLSSFKTASGLLEFPPTLLPLGQVETSVEGYDKPLPLYNVTLEDGSCLLYTSPSPRDKRQSRMPSSA